jgi:hypothetical protein
MRFFEFADAEAQLGLLRTIIDNTWAAIAKQAEEQRQAEAQRKANAKLKPRKRQAGMGKVVSIPFPKPTRKPTPQSPLPKPMPNAADPQPPQSPNSALPTTQQNLAQRSNGVVSRLNNASFGAKTYPVGGD